MVGSFLYKGAIQKPREQTVNLLKTSPFHLFSAVLTAFIFASGPSAHAQETALPNEASLKPGQCYSLPDSKNYLESIKARASASQRTISEIGEQKISELKDTDATNYYFCRVKCKNMRGEMDSFWATHSDSPAHFSDMNGFLCAGVSIENVQIVGSIYGPRPVVRPYWAFDTGLAEMKIWLRSTNYSLSSSEFQAKMAPLRVTLNYIAAAYVSSTSPLLKEAGLTLSHFADATPEGDSALVKYASQLAAQNWQLATNYASADFYVANMIKTHGRFLEFPPPGL